MKPDMFVVAHHKILSVPYLSALDSLKDTNSRLIDYVKSINKKVGTANSGKEFSEITENNNYYQKQFAPPCQFFI
jgi:hypothetical protein